MKTVLVIGCAACVWEDVDAAKAIANYDAVYCVKQIGIHYPKFDVWATLHPEAMDGYEAERFALGLPNGYQIVAPPKAELSASHCDKGNIARRVSYLLSSNSNESASSGIYGATVALADGFEKIVMAGIPLTVEGGHFMPDGKTVSGQRRGTSWDNREAFVKGFNMAVPKLIGKVKSMSGHTKAILGAPTQDWLNG